MRPQWPSILGMRSKNPGFTALSVHGTRPTLATRRAHDRASRVTPPRWPPSPALPPRPYRCPHRAESLVVQRYLRHADWSAGVPTSWGWSRAAPAPQANVRRRLLRRLSDARNRTEIRAGDTRDVARSVRPYLRRGRAISAIGSLRSRRLRTFAWGAGAARDQPQNVGIPRSPASRRRATESLRRKAFRTMRATVSPEAGEGPGMRASSRAIVNNSRRFQRCVPT